jgi:xanthine dehydrogenase accessory factor
MSYEIIRELAAGCSGCALVTVMRTEGSVPRHAGSKMLVRRDGTIRGTVGGGRPEALAIERALRVIETRGFDLLSVEMHGTEAEGDALVCGGTYDMVIESVHDPQPYRVALDLLVSGRRALLVKNVNAPATGNGACPVSVIDEGGETRVSGGMTTNPERVKRALLGGRTAYDEEGSLLYDPQFPEAKLLILGGGHVGRAVAAFASVLEFAITVSDDRPGCVDPAHFPAGVQLMTGDYTRAVDAFPWDPATYVVIMTRGHLFDLECLRAVLLRPWRYAGLIGSTRKTTLLLDQARSEGFDPVLLDRVHAPIGLDIGAETPEEIAVSVLAEMIAIRRRDGHCSMAPLSRARRLSTAGTGMPGPRTSVYETVTTPAEERNLSVIS